MKITTMCRCVGDGVKNVVKNGLMSLASVGTISACLIILGIVYCLVMNLRSFTGDLDKNVGMVAFLKSGITEEEVNQLTIQLSQRKDIESFHYVSADEAWADFKQEMLGGDEITDELMEELNADNPLANASNFEIYPVSAGDQDGIADFLKASPLVRKVNYSANAAQTLDTMTKLVTYVGFGLILFLICIAILLISNTIRISVYTRRTEISIMKYIGATDSFVRLPFVVEGVLIGVLGAVGPVALVYFGYDALVQLIMEKFSGIMSLFTVLSVDSIMMGLLPLLLGISIVVGVFGSVISIRKYLRA
ncbi:MAG: ABC transporter permease [Lachnospiraceae bacterium]|nr:ABC transporter permease [Lachnospiraceae bacterium]